MDVFTEPQMDLFEINDDPVIAPEIGEQAEISPAGWQPYMIICMVLIILLSVLHLFILLWLCVTYLVAGYTLKVNKKLRQGLRLAGASKIDDKEV